MLRTSKYLKVVEYVTDMHRLHSKSLKSEETHAKNNTEQNKILLQVLKSLLH